MVKVNNPLTGHGKILISYNGKNELLKNLPQKMKPIYMRRHMKVQDNVYENLIIETELFDNTTVCFSLRSANLYLSVLVNNEQKWVTNEEDCAAFYNINADIIEVIFEGNISFNKEITPEFISRETYDVILILRNSKDLMDLLNKNNIEYQYHSYSKPELQE